MDDPSGNSRLQIEHYPLNKHLIIKDLTNDNALKINTRKFVAIDNPADAHLLTHAYKNVYKAEAVYGKIVLHKHSYLIVVSRSKMVGRILGHPIFQVQDVEFINLTVEESDSQTASDPAPGPAKDPDVTADLTAIQMLREHLDSGNVYYSFKYNLTCTMQNQVSESANVSGFDPNYCINAPYAKKFMSLKGADRFACGFIYGYLTQRDLFLKTGRITTFTLISRKHVERLGTRFYSRGIDADGYVSNFVETEVILEVAEAESARRVFSHVQIRGSIPLFWTQRPTLKYTPSIELGKSEQANEHAMLTHFRRLAKKYNGVQCVNLIDKSGSQFSIGTAFERVFNAVRETQPDLSNLINLIWFDYHHECRGGKVDKLRNVLDFIKVNVADYGMFEGLAVSDDAQIKKVINTQRGVIRTNCIDCLDRTNVMQSVVSRQTLHAIFGKLGMEAEGLDPLAPLPEFFEPTFREFWTGNANQLSRMYAGTDALKTDVTKTGKRTYKGMINDGKNSVVRYFINNLADHHTQNSLGLLTDSIKPEQLKDYKRQKVSQFLAAVAIMLLVPILVRLLFGIMGVRCTGGTMVALTGLSAAAAYFYVQDKKDWFLKGDLPRN